MDKETDIKRLIESSFEAFDRTTQSKALLEISELFLATRLLYADHMRLLRIIVRLRKQYRLRKNYKLRVKFKLIMSYWLLVLGVKCHPFNMKNEPPIKLNTKLRNFSQFQRLQPSNKLSPFY